MITMMFGLESFKGFASAPITVVITAMLPQRNAHVFAQFQIADSRDFLIGFSMFKNDAKRAIDAVLFKERLNNRVEGGPLSG